jgi:hypothetical protein
VEVAELDREEQRFLARRKKAGADAPVALLVGLRGRLDTSTVRSVLEAVVEARERAGELIESMVPRAAVASEASVLQARRNAEARTALLEEFGALTSAEVARLAGSRAANRAALANRWRREGRIFAVSHGRAQYYPAFQFDELGQPQEVIGRVLEAFAGRGGDWEVALWFTTSSGWLGGRRPVDLLDEDPEAVVGAARHAVDAPDF